MCKVGDMVIIEWGGSYTNKDSSFQLLEIKRVTKTLVIVGKYKDDKELYKFKKDKNDHYGYIARLETGRYTSDHKLYDINNEEIIKKHLELSLNKTFEMAKFNLIEQIKNNVNTFDDYYKINDYLIKLEGNELNVSNS